MIDYYDLKDRIVAQIKSNPNYRRGEFDLNQIIQVYHVDEDFSLLKIPKRFFSMVKCPDCNSRLAMGKWFYFLKYESIQYKDMKCQRLDWI